MVEKHDVQDAEHTTWAEDVNGPHGISFRFAVSDNGRTLRVTPRPLKLWAIIAWLVFIHVVGAVLVYWFEGFDDLPAMALMAIAIIVPLEFVTLTGAMIAFNWWHMKQGPLFEVDRVARVVRLLRDEGERVPVNEVEAVHLLKGWRTWGSKPNTTTGSWIELGLLVRDEDGGRKRRLLLSSQAWMFRDPTERLAQQLAEALDRSLRRAHASRESE